MIISVGVENIYLVTCYNLDGSVAWVEEIKNLVPTAGLNDLLNKYLKGSAYTATWYIGLIDNANFSALAAGDTAAKITISAPTGATNGWKESLVYSETTRRPLVLGTVSAGSVDNSASLATYSINGTATLKGAFVVSSSAKAGVSGVLYGEGAFAATHAVVNGNSITVKATLTAATA